MRRASIMILWTRCLCGGRRGVQPGRGCIYAARSRFQLRSSAYCVPSQRPFCSPYFASERVEVELKEQLQELKEWKQTAAEADFPI
jgi:hypothetical protein